MANRVTTIFDAVDRGLSDAVNRVKKSINEAEGAAGKLKAGWKGVVAEFKNSREAQVAAAAATAAVVAGSIKAASDLEESINAVTVQYGDSADAVLKLGENSAESFGMSQRAFNEFAVGFSAFADQIAQNSGQRVEDVVGQMAQRIADFASVHNLSMEEAETVAKSTLAGETEAFRRFGGDVSAATVKTFAYEEGIAKVGAELTEGQKVLARYGLFMEQTGKTAGDFANTSDSLANQQRVLRARTEDLAAAFGKHLIPEAADAAGKLNEVITAVQNLEKATPGVVGGIKKANDAIRDWMFGIKPLVDVAERLNEKFGETEEATRDMADAQRHATTAANIQAEAAHNQAAIMEVLTDQSAELERGTEKWTKATEDAAEAQEQAAAVAGALSDALVDQLQASRDLRNEQRRLADAVYDLHDAEDDLAAQVVEATEILKSEDTTLRQARDAMETTAQKADALAQKQVELAGQTTDTDAGFRTWMESMLETAGTLSGPLREEVLNHISRVSGIPRDVFTQFDVGMNYDRLREIENDLNWTARQRTVRIDPVSGGVPRYAHGTMDHPGGWALLGEQGPELAELPAGTKVHTASQTRGMLSGGRSLNGTAGGGATYNITVNASLGANGYEIGRKVAEWLREYERAGGRR